MRIIRRPLRVPSRKKLRAAAHRSPAKYTEEDYAAEEPNVKLSRAFVVVLLLHVVAVGGIFAFSALKDHQTGSSTGKPESAGQKPPTTQSNAGRESGTADKPAGKAVPAEVQKIVDSSHVPGNSSAKSQSSGIAQEAGESARVYVVQRGDSPAAIAKKFKVSYADLLRTNNIEDPKRLQIGQKLVIP
ncbi:MAG: LysM peptidoglycan-binding domain-containing protein [Verrucomicrobia bacterium]|nr:LysM peptidoglycan-binding domain-containing protein [Verrucomicrobiota bacterium]MBV9130138.1 LysM peptidoglycan-binding domain-containing protein [Verrucomicrobiota bacterium]MBV9642038.1 LysM peptidoglycan-binding domain-containing protein [Verrucomicrobiota bacterium]